MHFFKAAIALLFLVAGPLSAFAAPLPADGPVAVETRDVEVLYVNHEQSFTNVPTNISNSEVREPEPDPRNVAPVNCHTLAGCSQG